ncbi:Periplasmic formate dehydrogenase FdhABC, gamma subunit (NrfD-family protein) [Desulfatibacillum aliphaticivorans]|uniref:Periplasmic formate dehydrogenase FdhABC, gamma subunit (NrfD-family protein) n=1 Tax=Desulfatibacillum aliphaticivorans TaxID=218208 RepID=B8FFZ8_DESAL|nr:NrfD/PsrC family molybdoenzyme membrane anchor subunit [Desulfatibacillum aliphaticivorans]ACL03553.1 Periplasmic formate dehydrogenase FdhABC, gamma subunit (NrfD-family protein) [Desulfatibacillum aliphaticivorans]
MNRKTAPIHPGPALLGGLACLGLSAVIYRFWAGIGAVSNLTDGHPWGFWVAIDILAGVALAAGGFVTAGLVYIFGGKRFAELARPAVLTAFLGYVMFVLGLIVDMGRPWHMLYIFVGNHNSPLYEIGWCASLYTLVLALELLPPVFEKYSMDAAQRLWRSLSPWLVIVLLSVFTLAMTYSWIWLAIVASLLLAWEILMRKGVMGRQRQTPILLIASGVMLSFLHQSSLGSLYLMTAHSLNPLWHSPLLPIMFLISAIAAGMAMVALESLAGERFLGHKAPFSPLVDMARIVPVLLIIYLVMKAGDILPYGDWRGLLSLNLQSFMWWVEMGAGVAAPLILYLTPGFVQKRSGLALASGLVVGGLIINRVNVAVIGLQVQRWQSYYPHPLEILITMGIVSAGLLTYAWASANLPIHTRE